jgi:hypothetical protein
MNAIAAVREKSAGVPYNGLQAGKLPAAPLKKNPAIRSDWGRQSHQAPAQDSRLVSVGDIIPAQYYADQPYLVATPDGAWLCVVTTGSGHEGSRGQHIRSLRSTDFGKTWSDEAAIESPDGPEASWAVPLVSPTGRIYVFYVYNGQDIRELPADDPPASGGRTTRMDSHGEYVFRWSDDCGRTWSRDRVEIPVREFEIDRENSTGGEVRLFWNVGRPMISRGSVFLTLHKVGGFGAGWFTRSEGALVKSGDLLLLDDPRLATWETLPEGDVGLRTPPGYGPIAEEQSLLELSDGSFFCVYRSIDGHPVGSYSRDRGAHWEQPRFLEDAAGRPLKHPRAACFAWRLEDGAYVLWFHNHGGVLLRQHPERRDRGYDDRNPVWLCRGREVETSRGLELIWETPEIALYEDDPTIRMSYPDLREEKGAIYLTETQKSVARVHRLGERLVRVLRDGAEGIRVSELRREAVFEWSPAAPVGLFPSLPPFLARSPESPYGTTDQRSGFSLELRFAGGLPSSPAVLAEAWDEAFGGLRLEWLAGGVLNLTLSDGRSEFSWRSDAGGLADAGAHHAMIVVDGGPKIISFCVDGCLCDGGEERQFGWGRFSPLFRGLPGGVPWRFTAAGRQSLREVRIYPRALFFTEARALFLASGPGASSGDE